ncbi:hypothetical protein [Rhodococcus koreensis]|uniref:hypothetical protein n=1 Tax=Rhodococcus koreensis TaxID=99653 RepID=UPI0019804EE5|nr:hypothetical protein [Rhodococcus koreensis]QSE86890.1 hypothetical protein JWS14_48605 [Rhodococcus koreensis]
MSSEPFGKRTNRHFHGLLDYTLIAPDEYVFGDLLEQCRRRILDGFPGTLDAIIAHWDFHTRVLALILAAERVPRPRHCAPCWRASTSA